MKVYLKGGPRNGETIEIIEDVSILIFPVDPLFKEQTGYTGEYYLREGLGLFKFFNYTR